MLHKRRLVLVLTQRNVLAQRNKDGCGSDRLPGAWSWRKQGSAGRVLAARATLLRVAKRTPQIDRSGDVGTLKVRQRNFRPARDDDKPTGADGCTGADARYYPHLTRAMSRASSHSERKSMTCVTIVWATQAPGRPTHVSLKSEAWAAGTTDPCLAVKGGMGGSNVRPMSR